MNAPARKIASPLLLGCAGCGSAIVEAAFALAGLPLEREEVDYGADSPTRDRLIAVNPLGQVPALLLADGSVLTESLAIVHYVNDLVPSAGLVPPTGDPDRREYYRWQVFLVAAVYPTYTYGDDAARWVGAGDAAKALRKSTDEHRRRLWLQVEAAAKAAPWFLGERFSSIDLYLGVMTWWRPGKAWIEEYCPKLEAIAKSAQALPGVGEVIRRNMA
jgi:GST-like protein